MGLNIKDFHENDFGLNLAWFENANGIDRDLILWQGQCPDCGEDCFVRLHPVHTALLAKELGLLTAQEAAQRVARLQDRLALLAALVRAHKQPAAHGSGCAACRTGEALGRRHRRTALGSPFEAPCKPPGRRPVRGFQMNASHRTRAPPAESASATSSTGAPT
jgi:hypothetical protein